MSFTQNRNFRILLFMIADAIVVWIGAILALALRFDINAIPAHYIAGAKHGLLIYVLVAILVMALFRLYTRVWSHASTKELIDIFKASIMIEALIALYHVLAQDPMPRSYYVIHGLVIFILFVLVRFSKTIWMTVRGTHAREEIVKRVLLVGAGAAAAILIEEVNKGHGLSRIVCAIDDNPNKKGKLLKDVPIVGARDDIAKAVKQYDVNEIIITMPSAKAEDVKAIIALCQKTGLPTKILPYVVRSLEDSAAITREIRPINYEDLLGRDPIKVDQSEIGAFLKDKVILVTGGGGTIGSELCRQIIRYNPKKLIIFDIFENNAYDIQMELEYNYPKADISTLIGSVRDYDRMENLFSKYHPNIVYHAAAHKHVPLMEKSPNEAIKNNCFGTWNVARLADKYKADHFVLISTDKAVRPTSLMGATKRICEMIVQTYARRSKHTKFAAVRFGNVLGSSGSVIPLFLKQIDAGGPVTVTHRDIVRFFMTISEAVSLVIQASAYASGGEIFILDMGKPMKIYDLAVNLIKMKGLRPNVDIDIEIVGLRPGEKLYEEVLMDEEGLQKTANDMIYVGQPIKMDDEQFLKDLQHLIDESYKNGHHIKEITEEVCGTYTITDN